MGIIEQVREMKLEEAREKVRRQARKKIRDLKTQIVKRMLARKLPLNDIAALAGVTPSFVQKIKRSSLKSPQK